MDPYSADPDFRPHPDAEFETFETEYSDDNRAWFLELDELSDYSELADHGGFTVYSSHIDPAEVVVEGSWDPAYIGESTND